MNNALFVDPLFIGLLLQKGPAHAGTLLKHLSEPNPPKHVPEIPFSLPAYTETYEVRLARIHPTWLGESLGQLSNFEKRILEEERESKGKWIGDHFKRKIQEKLWLKLKESRPRLLPFNLARPDVLIPLTQTAIAQYEIAWFTLGLRDLASSFKKIIDAKIIRLIQSTLSDREQEILKIYSQEKEVITFPKINLHSELSSKELREMVFERGMNRMAKGFKELGPDALWHFCRHLPKVYGLKMEQLSMSSIPPEVSQILFQQAYETVMQGGSS